MLGYFLNKKTRISIVENSNWQQEHIQYPNVDWNQNASIVQMTDPSGSEANIRRWN